MTTNHKPATPLPWHLGIKQAEQIVYDVKGWAVANATVYHGKADGAETKANAAYIAHAANAYPRLVAALRELMLRCDGAEGVRADGSNIQTMKASALLQDLGEL